MSDYQHKKIFIEGPAGVLQALYHTGRAGRPAVVVCHPHPQFGGTMRNKVVYWMARAFEEAGCSVLRFNFRGVEQSEGVWDEGKGEADDARAALDWMDEVHPESRLWLAGFSFGCFAGLQAARTDDRVSHMFAVAPAVNLWPFAFMIGENRPITVISGTADEIVPFDKVARSVKGKSNIRFHPIEGAGHFFPQHMDQMAELLLADVRFELV
ncbi:MAG: alpha/beta hydrolase [Zetaproteobacteria bacterium CG_4_9_14_3_um_filter_53_7]|nr:MAG: alpha/beta hydrolase [Zetaproteobacteria bacterium CG_4_9_14_3_um_filter_53_7]